MITNYCHLSILCLSAALNTGCWLEVKSLPVKGSLGWPPHEENISPHLQQHHYTVTVSHSPLELQTKVREETLVRAFTVIIKYSGTLI